MSEETDSWMQQALGVDVVSVVQNVVDAGAAVGGVVAEAGAAAAQTAWNAGAPRVQGVVDAGAAGVEGVGAAAGALMQADSAAGIVQAEWNLTKSVASGVAGVYDAVTPDYTSLNKSLGEAVDSGEAYAKQADQYLVAQVGDVPVVGTAARTLAAVNEKVVQAAGGIVKGAGDLGAMAGNLLVHPLDTAPAIYEGVANIVEHVPLTPGLGTAAKGVHGLVDIARGKTDGKYGRNLDELADNLLHDTQSDPNDPSKRVNTDVEFAASFGGGRKAWEDKPVEAATRTVTNLLPMLFGEGGARLPEEIPGAAGASEVRAAGAGAAKVPRGATTIDMAGESGSTAGRSFATADTELAPGAAAADDGAVGASGFDAVSDLQARLDAAADANFEATGAWVRYRQNMPREGFAGDLSKWDPAVDAKLEAAANRAAAEHTRLVHEAKDAPPAAAPVAAKPGGTARLDPVPQGRGQTAPLDPPVRGRGRTEILEPAPAELTPDPVVEPAPEPIVDAYGDTVPPDAAAAPAIADTALPEASTPAEAPAPAPSVSPAEAWQEAKQNYLDAEAVHRAAEAESIKAINELAQYRVHKPRADSPGDLMKWNPKTDAELVRQMQEARLSCSRAEVELEQAQFAMRASAKKARVKLPVGW